MTKKEVYLNWSEKHSGSIKSVKYQNLCIGLLQIEFIV